MLNSYSTNFIKNNKPYAQINIDKISRPAMNNRKRACSINIDKMKSKGKIMPSANSLNKKNVILKTISVNKQIQYKKKAIGQFKIDNNCLSSFNCNSNIKENSYNNNNTQIKQNKTQNFNLSNNKNYNLTQSKKQNLNNYSNNKLRRKMILSVDINNININNNNNDISQNNDHNNITSISEMNTDQNNNMNNNEYSVTCGNSNPSNPMSNGAKANSVNKNKPKTLSVNYQNHSRSNVNIKSPQKNTVYSNNLFNTCVGNNNKKGRNPSNNIVLTNTNIKNNNSNSGNNNSNIKNNIQIKQPFKLYNDNSSSINLTTSCNSYQIQLNKVNHNENNNNNNFTKCNNFKNPNNNTSNFYKSQNINNHESRMNSSINNNYKFLKEVIDIQTEMDKSLKENPTNSKSKKYNTLKHAFENLLKLLGNTIFKYNNNIINVFLEKILIGYHEVVSAFSIENRKLKQLNIKINEQYEKGNKELIILSKSIKEKQKQIEFLQKKILEEKKNSININNGCNMRNNNNCNGEFRENNDLIENTVLNFKQEQNKKVFKMNEQNLDDLDALYFFDKIEMETQKCPSSKGVPKIPLKRFHEEEEDDDNDFTYKIHHAKTKSDMTFGNNTKFKSLAFLKVKQAFN